MSAKQLVDGIVHLVSLPDVCVKVNRLVDSPGYSAVGVGRIVAHDTDLSARILRLVNSSYFGLRAPVDTISRAIAVVGTNELRNLVMATTAARVFTGIPADLVDMARFWRYSVMTGLIAKELALRCSVLHSERLFVMGMLHDIGRLVIYLTLPDQSRDILLITGGDDNLLAETEKDVLGFTHMDVGAELLRNWRLPDGLVSVVGAHHEPFKAGDYQFDAALIHVAIALTHGEMSGLSFDEVISPISPSIWDFTGLSVEDLESVIKVAPVKAAEVIDLIYKPVGRVHS
jgi:putative nucleotidyltransferase with HDIG domain